MASTSDHLGAANTARILGADTRLVAASVPHVPHRTHASSAVGARRSPRERRSSARLVRFTSGELAAVALRATECGRPVACYIREAALGAALHARRTPVSDALIRELARLGNELGAIGRKARDLQLPIASEFERALDVLLTTIRSIE